MSVILINAALSLRAEINHLAPGRSTASDGWIGDTAHQEETSDHNPDETGSVPIHDADKTNEVHAIDVDDELHEPGLTMEMVVQHLLFRCRSGAEKRLRYIIYDRRIWEASQQWQQRDYHGASPHTEHAHFSFSYTTTLEASQAPWHLEEIPVALTAQDKAWLAQHIDVAASQAAVRVWSTKMQRPGEPAGTFTTAAAYQSYNDVVNRDTANAAAEAVVKHLAPQLAEILSHFTVTAPKQA